ncbi:MAG: PD-(D/E)XK nuclease-like domain-containing protein [Trueperaceae bacterium]|nr:PD-(D/E)XK nuclease-like domain-containing protein [Trueperaceae bacterium]
MTTAPTLTDELELPDEYRPDFEPGRYAGVPNQVYHACPSISSSSISELSRSVDHYLAAREKEKSSDALDFGTMFHTALLEPGRFREDYLDVQPPSKADGSGWRSKVMLTASLRADGHDWEQVADEVGYKQKTVQAYADKDGFDELVAHFDEHDVDHDQAFLSDDDHETIAWMDQAIHSHPLAHELMTGGEARAIEHSFWWVDPVTGVPCRCRPDLLLWFEGQWVIVDLKSARDASYWGFRKAIARRGYHSSAAMYADGVSQHVPGGVQRFLFIAVEKEAPFGIDVYEIDEAGVEQGRDRYRTALQDWREYLESPDRWTGYGDGESVTTIDVPGWAG